MEEIKVEYLPIWRRYLDMFDKLSDRDRGTLLWAMMEYQFKRKEPESLKKSLEVYWMFIRNDLDYARHQYETSVLNGRKGGRKKKKQPEQTQENLDGAQENPEEGKSTTETITNQEQEHKQ